MAGILLNHKYEKNETSAIMINETALFINTFNTCVKKVVNDGYSGCFKITDEGLYSVTNNKTYQPAQIHLINSFRFQGQSDPADNAVLYVIETDDTLKGILVDAFGICPDEKITKFIAEAEQNDYADKSL